MGHTCILCLADLCTAPWQMVGNWGHFTPGHNVVNCLDFYDSFLGIQSNYKYDVTDDIDYLTSSTFFIDNIDKLYTLENVDIEQYKDNESRKKRSKLCISKSNHNISAISITECLTDVSDITTENLNDCIL